MAFELPGMVISRKAAADLSGDQYKFVKLDANGDVVRSAAAADVSIGVLQNKPTSGQVAEVMVYGITKLSANAAINEGDKLASSADGQAAVASVAAASTDWIVAIAIGTAAAADEIFEALLVHAGPQNNATT